MYETSFEFIGQLLWSIVINMRLKTFDNSIVTATTKILI